MKLIKISIRKQVFQKKITKQIESFNRLLPKSIKEYKRLYNQPTKLSILYGDNQVKHYIGFAHITQKKKRS